MKLPQIQDTKRYTGLYVVDFGGHSATGFTANEVAELLESEKFAHIKVYKIHSVRPDGTMELKGIRNEMFQLETGMFFYAADEKTARGDFKRLTDIAVVSAAPARAKAAVAKLSDKEYVTSLIYPAEYDDEFSRWLLDNNYRTSGAVQGGAGYVEMYSNAQKEVLDNQQLWAADSFDELTSVELVAATKRKMVR